MSRIFISLTRIIVIFGLFIPVIASAEKATVIDVIDGDTIIVKLNNGKTKRINLSCIDAPELAQPYGAEAKEFLESMALNQVVYIKNTRSESSSILLGNSDLSWKMLRSGHAWSNGKNRKMSKFQRRAKKAKKGLWANTNPKEPSKWRKINKFNDGPNVDLSEMAARSNWNNAQDAKKLEEMKKDDPSGYSKLIASQAAEKKNNAKLDRQNDLRERELELAERKQELYEQRLKDMKRNRVRRTSSSF